MKKPENWEWCPRHRGRASEGERWLGLGLGLTLGSEDRELTPGWSPTGVEGVRQEQRGQMLTEVGSKGKQKTTGRHRSSSSCHSVS